MSCKQNIGGGRESNGLYLLELEKEDLVGYRCQLPRTTLYVGIENLKFQSLKLLFPYFKISGDVKDLQCKTCQLAK